MTIQIKRVGDHTLPQPSRASTGAAGYDLSASEDLVLLPSQSAAIRTGFAWAIPPRCVGLVRPRSGLAVRSGIDILAGVIDSDFRGEVCAVLINHGNSPLKIKQGDRIAQMVVTLAATDVLVEVHTLDDTMRGAGGFGSTGTN